ncbi:hypothetical protein [uncultured Bradyrhizobium sp.]|uniref:hypothetical protein n=1 Tax=uncultured Bradyrhizobium sp. TaxID=199684 RepID=UPI002636345F|nr:hypothetical protein [uncultured Bradyrhizobium sp.]
MGDTARQAVASLRGYAYQIAVAALAWIDLDASAALYLEVAEDYATVAGDALKAVQVKDTAASGSVTLNTGAVRDAIAAFVDLKSKNPSLDVQLHYLTTSAIGTEQKLQDRPGGEAGLAYWRKAAAGAEIEPLRRALTGSSFAKEVAGFVGGRDDEALRHELIQKIHWDCSQPDLGGVLRELEERLIVIGREKFSLASMVARRLADTILYRVLQKSILPEMSQRVLRRADFYEVVDAATQTVVSHQVAQAIFQAVPGLLDVAGVHGGKVPISTSDTDWLAALGELPKPAGTIPRPELSTAVRQALASAGHAFLIGGSGLGKSLVARDVASGENYALLDLREVAPDEAARRLDMLLGRLGGLDVKGIIFDDLNCLENTYARVAFGRCLEALRRRDRTAIVTAYRTPSQKTLTELGSSAVAVLNVPYFSEADAGRIVEAAGGSPGQWGAIAFAAGAQGHPQLVHAFVMGMAVRGWRAEEFQKIVIQGFSSDDVEAEREAARRGMAIALSAEARALLYRLTLVIGRFTRDIALSLGSLEPRVPHAGEELDRLVGPWIEVVAPGQYRVSPLATNAGQGMLTAIEQTDVHALIVDRLLARRVIDPFGANMILTHAFIARSAHGLMAMAHAVLEADEKTTELLAEHFFMLPILRTDQPIFDENRAISVMLRLAQFKLAAIKEDGPAMKACAIALQSEIAAESDEEIKNALESMSLGIVLNTIGIAAHLPNWFTLLRRFKVLAETTPALEEVTENFHRKHREDGNLFGNLFSVGSASLPTVERLQEIIDALDGVSKEERAFWLSSFERPDHDVAILVNGPWSREQSSGAFDARSAAERFKHMAELAHEWGMRDLAIQCVVARVVMLDEYMDDLAGAHAVLDEGSSLLGSDVVLERARAKLYWRHKDNARAVEIFRRIGDRIGLTSAVDRAFVMREAAISAANIGDWKQAEVWFGEAQKAAAKLDMDGMQAMAVGLIADGAVAAYEAGNIDDALMGMSKCLDELRKLDPDASRRAAYCHRVARHTVLWLDTQTDGRVTLIDGKPIMMLPGSCSNPEPPASIVELPCGPLDLAWYMLAEAEISSGRQMGISASLRSKLELGPILFMEITIGNRRLAYHIRNGDAGGFAKHLEGYLAGLAVVEADGPSWRETFDIMAPPRGEIPALNRPFSVSAEAQAADAIVAFELAAFLTGRSDSATELQSALQATFGTSFPGKAVFEKRDGNPNGTLDMVVLSSMKQLRTGEHVEPRRIWEIGLRFFERARQSGFKGILVPLVATWMRIQWERIVEHESFRLSRPIISIPDIRSVLTKPGNDEAFAAALILRTAEAIGSPLAAAYIELLRGIADPK